MRSCIDFIELLVFLDKDWPMNLELLTSRLRLTPLDESDIDISLELWTDPDVTQYICGVATEDELRAEMPDSTKRGGDGCIGIWCVADRVLGEKFGSAYILPMPVDDPDTDFSLLIADQMPDGDMELGYFLKRTAWNKGYATEVSNRLLEFAFRESPLNELVASVHDENVASKNVLEKSGFVYRGRARCYGEDSPIYRITRDEWDKHQLST
jgi:RimJ/RimL family protein N-acetyltransferase